METNGCDYEAEIIYIAINKCTCVIFAFWFILVRACCTVLGLWIAQQDHQCDLMPITRLSSQSVEDQLNTSLSEYSWTAIDQDREGMLNLTIHSTANLLNCIRLALIRWV